ncbi:MAG: class I SAM-dependent methyltransferase [Bradymonadia bacterium]
MLITCAAILGIIFVLDAFRLRKRVSGLGHVSFSENSVGAEQEETYVVLTRAGYQISKENERQLMQHAERHGLAAYDAIPSTWHTLAYMGLAQMVDFLTYRETPLAKGVSGGWCFVAKRDLLQRMEFAIDKTSLPADALIDLARRAKLYSPRGTDLLICSALPRPNDPMSQRRQSLEAQLGDGWRFVPIAQFVLAALLVALACFNPLWGALAAVCFHLQPMIIFGGQTLIPMDLIQTTLLRTPLELILAIATLTQSSTRTEDHSDDDQDLRQTYAQLVQPGLGQFFEEEATHCPLCGARELAVQLRTSDIIQKKPGRFQLSRCVECQHIFQNPRLSIEGLNYYYKDFYDGLGEDGLAAVFGYSAEPYEKRASMLKGHHEPNRWLDVGAGHGHFCLIARDIWPETRFDALDLSSSVDEAARRGWADTGINGLFPEAAPDIAEAYDVVSMSHYLEHTRDPEAELVAAHQTLIGDGKLMIEVPDPDCKLGRWLGRYWVPWFQPQHQHLLSSANLTQLLQKTGFEVVEWHFGKAHQPVDFFFAAYLQLNAIAPAKDLPWSPPLSFFERCLHRGIWGVGSLWLMFGWLLDRVAEPAMKSARHSNTMRVLARKKV